METELGDGCGKPLLSGGGGSLGHTHGLEHLLIGEVTGGLLVGHG